MVICQGRLDEVVPIEPTTMPGRTVIAWDKDDWAALGILKIDLLGLGMMGVLQDAFQLPEMNSIEALIADFRGTSLSASAHPFDYIRPNLDKQGIVRASDLVKVRSGQTVQVAGMVIVRNKPPTAKGMVF
jgi:DNA polymerase III alpha subunit